jgi:hypothetical protein
MSLLPVGIGAGDAGYEIEKSLRFRASASAYLSRTPGSAGNRRTWTWSGWVKRGALANGILFANAAGAPDYLGLVSDQIRISFNGGGNFIATTALYRDPSAHFHILLAMDTVQATAANRTRLYVNGVEVTAFSTAGYPAQNYDTSFNVVSTNMLLGQAASSTYFDGYLSEINFIDGQALTPTSFGEFDSNGVWVAKKYSGTYGTNGFYLPFNDGTNLTNLCLDRSGNANNWTATNVSLTAGATYDWMDDTPTNGFAVLNPLQKAVSANLSNANLTNTTGASGYGRAHATIAVASGKWYWEALVSQQTFQTALMGIGTSYSDTFLGGASGDIAVVGAVSAGDVLAVALDMDSLTATGYRNGAVVAGPLSLSSGTYFPVFSDSHLTTEFATINANFGQRPFAYTPPTGFQALCTKNLPAPAIAKPSDHFDVVLATGANIKTTAEGLFTHQLAWIKDRANSNNHQLIDSVRGTSAVLQSNTTAAETTYTAPSGSSVGWVWAVPDAGVINTAGTITSTVSANTTAGFSVVTYTGTGANATVGHGLGVVPKMVIVKRRNSTSAWPTQHADIVAANSLYLNTSAESTSATTVWNSAKPTSTLFSIGTSTDVNANTGTYVAYSFAEIPGFSRIGSYTGNGSADGPFVYCGFRPRWVMMKRATGGTSLWWIQDAERSPTNGTTAQLYPNDPAAEGTTLPIDLLSNGFKVRHFASQYNESGSQYIFLAFAEHPFNSARAR